MTPRASARRSASLAFSVALAAQQLQDGKPLTEDTRFRDKLSRVEVELMALDHQSALPRPASWRCAPGAEVSMLKIKGTEIQQALTELMMQAVGPLAQPFAPVDRGVDFDDFTARSAPRI
jgi:alkylation response protein AidB-like acyl-CoA dehydrogenase